MKRHRQISKSSLKPMIYMHVHIGGVVMAEVVEVTTQFFFSQPKRTCCNSKITPLNSQVHSSAFRNLHFNSVQKHL